MMRYFKLYLVSLAAFLAIDLLWLGVVTRTFYSQYLGYIMAPSPNWLAAIIFYLLFIVGILFFVVVPGLESGSLKTTLLRAALFGLITYATYVGQKLCGKYLRTNDQIDVFIFNAGVMAPPYLMTENGFESQFQVNYLSHYYLFSWLKDLLLKGELKKVISISSLSSEKGVNGTIADFERDSGCEKNAYNAMKCYRESKFAQILFTAELHNRFSKEGLKSYAVHPGVVNTNLFYRQTNALAKALIQPIAWLGYATGFLKTPEKGAETTVYLATNEVQESGLYWADKKIRKHNHLADNQKFLTAFWEWSAEIAEHSIQSNQSNPAFSGHGECPDWEIDAFSQS